MGAWRTGPSFPVYFQPLHLKYGIFQPCRRYHTLPHYSPLLYHTQVAFAHIVLFLPGILFPSYSSNPRSDMTLCEPTTQEPLHETNLPLNNVSVHSFYHLPIYIYFCIYISIIYLISIYHLYSSHCVAGGCLPICFSIWNVKFLRANSCGIYLYIPEPSTIAAIYTLLWTRKWSLSRNHIRIT